MNFQDEQMADYDSEERMYYRQRLYEEYIRMSNERRNIGLDLLDIRLND